MEVHSAPGPPRTSIVMARARRIAVLDVGPGRDTGSITLPDRSRFRIERPPGGGEWWITGPDGREVAVLGRRTLVRERFAVRLDPGGPARLDLEVAPVGSPWRRRWDVLDEAGRVLVEVVQRRWARSVHDVHVRTGDLPEPLPLVVAWTLALAVTPPVSETRRPRWTAHGA